MKHELKNAVDELEKRLSGPACFNVHLYKPTSTNTMCSLSDCCIRAVVIVAEDNAKVQHLCRGHFIEYMADLETFELPPAPWNTPIPYSHKAPAGSAAGK